jgi:hypothetical protein
LAIAIDVPIALATAVYSALAIAVAVDPSLAMDSSVSVILAPATAAIGAAVSISMIPWIPWWNHFSPFLWLSVVQGCGVLPPPCYGVAVSFPVTEAATVVAVTVTVEVPRVTPVIGSVSFAPAPVISGTIDCAVAASITKAANAAIVVFAAIVSVVFFVICHVPPITVARRGSVVGT